MDTYRGFNNTANHWNSMVSTFLYRERYGYDANGNITRADRNGNLTANPLMDSLYYRYYAGTNRLEYVNDYGVTSYGVNVDLKNQNPGNYQYDAIGNITSAANRAIYSIKWNVYGKITEITKAAVGNATAQHIYYNYDPSGNRVGQFQRHNSGVNAFYNYIWYVRDAQGNVLAVYKVNQVKSASEGTLKLAEHHMYGSSRLGIINRDLNMDNVQKHTPVHVDELGDTYLINFTRGNKLFEVTNHLGNVMLTLTDKRDPQPVAGNPSVIASYKADVVSAADYSPFGMTLPGRVTNNHWQKYRYGFNGKESDSEVNGPYNELDYGMRVYEPRLGRFFSVDPLTKDYPWYTPYQFAGNKPIWAADLDGLEELEMTRMSALKRKAILQMPVAPKTTIGPAPPKTFTQQWRDSKNPIDIITYEISNGFYTLPQQLTASLRNADYIHNIGGKVHKAHGIEGERQRIDNFVNVASTLTGPLSREAMLAERAAQTLALGIGKLSTLEIKIVNDANKILNSKEFEIIQKAYEKGVSAEVKVGDRLVQYEPGWSYSEAMTLHNENGFMLGPKAFVNKQETGKTVIHELYRLFTQKTNELSVDLTKPYTDAALDASNKLAPYLNK